MTLLNWRKLLLMNKLLVLFVFVAISFSGFSQNTRNVESYKPKQPVYQSAKQEKKGFFSFLKRKKSKKTEVEQFRDRVSAVYKQRAKEEKKADKPQYTDSTYFGHKRPPKKRKPGKQKFCKVCRIKH